MTRKLKKISRYSSEIRPIFTDQNKNNNKLCCNYFFYYIWYLSEKHATCRRMR